MAGQCREGGGGDIGGRGCEKRGCGGDHMEVRRLNPSFFFWCLYQGGDWDWYRGVLI